MAAITFGNALRMIIKIIKTINEKKKKEIKLNYCQYYPFRSVSTTPKQGNTTESWFCYRKQFAKLFLLTPVQLPPGDWDTIPDVDHSGGRPQFVARHENQM